MLRHGGAIAVWTDVDSNEFESLRKYMALAKTQGQAIGLTYLELALDI
jgi:hypothetical protein